MAYVYPFYIFCDSSLLDQQVHFLFLIVVPAVTYDPNSFCVCVCKRESEGERRERQKGKKGRALFGESVFWGRM